MASLMLEPHIRLEKDKQVDTRSAHSFRILLANKEDTSGSPYQLQWQEIEARSSSCQAPPIESAQQQIIMSKKGVKFGFLSSGQMVSCPYPEASELSPPATAIVDMCQHPQSSREMGFLIDKSDCGHKH